MSRAARTIIASVTVLVAGIAAIAFVPSGGGADAAPRVAAIPPSFIGRLAVGSHLFWGTQSTATTLLRRAHAGGVRWIREDFPWSSLEPRPGVFNWTRSDALMAAAATARVHVLPILDSTAPWASTQPLSRSASQYPPARPRDFAAFAQAVMRRYGPRGTFWGSMPAVVPSPLTAIEIWNEPWGHWQWRPDPDPAAYARLVEAAVPAIRSIAPTTKILVAGDLYQVRTDKRRRTWLSELLAADPRLPRLVDGWSVHAYPGNFIASPDDTKLLTYSYDRVVLVHRALVARKAIRPIWITEVGWSSATASPFGVSERQQAAYLATAVHRALVDWRSFVAKIFVYYFGLSDDTPSDFVSGFALLHANGTPKLAWVRLTTMVKREQLLRRAALLAAVTKR